MNIIIRTGRMVRLFLAGVWLLLLTGCSEELGPESMPTASVSGRVTRSGAPIRGGWLEFMPIEGSLGRLRSARLGADGFFQVDRVAVGRVAIRVVGLKPPPEGPSSLLGQMYLIRREIPPGGTHDLEIDLDREARSINAR